MRAVRLVAAALFVTTTCVPGRAYANADADAVAVPNGVDSTARREDVATPGRRRSTTTQNRCTWSAVEPEVAAISDAEGGYSEAEGLANLVWVAPRTPGAWYWVDCVWGERYLVFAPERTPVSAARLAHQAKRHLDLAGPELALRPLEAASHYVNTETWLRVSDWSLRQSVVEVPGVSVTVDAIPQKVVWTIDTGTYGTDGKPHTVTVTCLGPGTAYRHDLPEDQQSSDCTHRWPRSSAGSPDGRLAISAVVVYRVTWSAAGAAGGGDLGEIQSAPTTVRAVVGEIQATHTAHR